MTLNLPPQGVKALHPHIWVTKAGPFGGGFLLLALIVIKGL